VGAVVNSRGLRRFVIAIGVVLAACASTDSRLQSRTYAPPGPALTRIAVIPFYAHRSYEASSRLGSASPELAAERLTRQITESILDAGIEIVPVDEVANAFRNVARSTAAIDSQIFAEAAGRSLGANGVLIGEVIRYRDPRGATAATRHPASVAFQVTLYEAPEGFKLWSARYDYTQPPPVASTGNALHDTALQKKWLTANEIAQRGTDEVAEALAANR
jgi:hypothetical protein